MYHQYINSFWRIRIRKSKKDRKHNGQQKRINNDLQNNAQKTKDRVTRTLLKTGNEHHKRLQLDLQNDHLINSGKKLFLKRL